MKNLIIMALLSLLVQSCNNASQSKPSFQDANIQCGNVKFINSINLADETVTDMGDVLSMTASGQTDLFCDPKGVATNTSAPLLMTPIDNTKPFTFTVKVHPQFTENGTYSAGAVLAFVDKTHWQKLCFEQDEESNHRIVTVRTVDSSDDNNHERSDSTSVYLRLSSDTKVIGNYYSEDGDNWHLVRIYKNEYPYDLYLSLSAQSPKDIKHTCLFSEITLVDRAVSDFRKGNM